MGDSRKYPYPTTGGINILNPLALRNFKMLSPPPPPQALQTPKSLTPPPLQNFRFFPAPLESLFDSLKFLLKGKLAHFPPQREGKDATQVCKHFYNKVHHSFAL